MTLFDEIAAHGNRNYDDNFRFQNPKLGNRIRCRDGFSLSVIAGAGTYSRPRPALLDLGDTPNFMYDVDADYRGPYTAVEVGFPSERPEPWAGCWETHCEDPNSPTDTVYGYVPVEMVRALIEAHGGES